MIKKSLALLLAGGLLSGAAMADTTNLLTNGSLDSSPLNGWDISGKYKWTTSDKYSASASDYFVKLVAKNAEASMTQTFATVAGMSYTVSFDYDSKDGAAFYGVNDGNAAAVANPDSVITWTQVSNGAKNMSHVSYTFTALSGMTTLGFSAASQGAKFVLNNIAVTAAVPEPASIALFMAGLGALGLVSRRRRVK